MQRRALLRASDQDREHVADRIREASLEGRLTSDELEERLGSAYAARTYGELDTLIADLPAPSPVPVPAKRSRSSAGANRGSHPLAWVASGTAFVVVLGGLVTIVNTGGAIAAHAEHAVGGRTIVHAFGLFAAAQAAAAAVVGVTLLLVLIAAVGWVLSRPWSTGDA
jgi:hypothetical protein